MSHSSPTTDAHQTAGKFPAAVTIFGILNLIAATEAAVFGLFVLPKAEGYRFFHRYFVGAVPTFAVDAFFLGEYTVRFVGIALLVAAGVGLLWKKPWGRSLSIGWAIAIMAAYLLMWIVGARYSFLALLAACAYPIALLFGMCHTNVVAAFGPSLERHTATATSPGRRKRRLRFALWHLLTAVAVLSFVLAGVAWWIHHPVQREIFKLTHGNRSVQAHACQRLGRMGPEAAEAVPTLIEQMNAPDADIYHPLAADALLKIGTVPALIAVLEKKKDYDNERYAQPALRALCSMGPDAKDAVKDAVPVLIEILEVINESPCGWLNYHFLHECRQRVVSLLGEIGPDAKAAIPALIDFANRSDLPYYDRELASKALDQIGFETGLEHLPEQTDVQSLSFNGSKQFTDAEAEHLKGLSNLKQLMLNATNISNDGLVHLTHLTRLESLNLSNTRITDAGLEHLKGLTNLKTLYLMGTQVTDDGLLHLKTLTKLQTLDLTGTQVTGAGLEHLQGLSNLKQLMLNATNITDAGLKDISGLANLADLCLDGTQVTDAGLQHLKGLRNLRVLTLNRARVSDTGVEDLSKALPNASILPFFNWHGSGRSLSE